jgi:CRISPR-associated endonuclease Csn1
MEFDRVYEKQMTFYPELLTKGLQDELRGKKRDAVWQFVQNLLRKKVELVGTKRQGSATEQKVENFTWRVKGLSEKLDLEQLVVCTPAN